MSGAIPPLSQYAFMVWCTVEEQGLYLYLYESTGQLVGLLGRVICPMQGLYLHTRTTQHNNTEKRGHAFIPPVGFEPIIPLSERPKTLRVSDRSAIGIGYKYFFD
jgi:hypothetical protein